MSILASIAALSLLLLAGLSPWWVAGRHFTYGSENVALKDLGFADIVDTLRRGASMYVATPAHIRN